jgi:hypothetical protein
MRQSSYRRRCRCSNPTLASDRAGATMTNINLLASGDWPGAPRREPSFDLGQVPYNASRGQCEASREFPALFHPEDRAVSERHHLFKLLAPDGPCMCDRIGLRHRDTPTLLDCQRLKARDRRNGKIRIAGAEGSVEKQRHGAFRFSSTTIYALRKIVFASRLADGMNGSGARRRG